MTTLTRQICRSIGAFLMAIGVSACAGDGGAPVVASEMAAPPQSNVVFPRLAPGPHIGFIEGFDDLTPKSGEPNRDERASNLRQQAMASGMSIGRAQIDWGELETSPGVFDAQTLDALLAQAERGGVSVFVTLSTIDITTLSIPQDLMGADDLLADGLRLNDETVTARFENFLDWLIPKLASKNVWGLAIGNEVDAIVNDGLLSKDEVLGHLLEGARYVKQLDPNIAVTVTLTGDSNLNVPSFTNDLVSGLDFVSFNTYCLNSSDLTISTPAVWIDVLTRWRRTAGAKPYFIQELGCPVGYGDDGQGAPSRPPNGIGGSPQTQVEFFEYYLGELRSDDQFRAATIFQLYDWSPELAKRFGDSFRDAGDELAGDRLEEWLATVGLCRWADVSCRPAWTVVLEEMERIEAERNAQAG